MGKSLTWRLSCVALVALLGSWLLVTDVQASSPHLSASGQRSRDTARVTACGRRLIKQVLLICNNCVGGSNVDQVRKSECKDVFDVKFVKFENVQKPEKSQKNINFCVQNWKF